MDYILANHWLLWTLIGAFFLLIELATVSLVSIWFVAAAAVTAVLSVWVESLGWQIVIFLVLSAVFVIAFRSLYKNRIARKKADIKPEDQLVGRYGTTAEATDSHGGKVLVGDVYWRAVTADGSLIEKNQSVVIKEVRSTTVIIEKAN